MLSQPLDVVNTCCCCCSRRSVEAAVQGLAFTFLSLLSSAFAISTQQRHFPSAAPPGRCGADAELGADTECNQRCSKAEGSGCKIEAAL